ncbi:MAG: hypothetical protein K6E29_08675 [Cyanobacteria bacterium RUI128]|nr:hypothetical protein [Cyanobacteria bacterium RUI128]
MKVAPSYVSRSRLLKKIEQRAAERAERIHINENVDIMDKAIIEAQSDNLARYASRHNCSMRFVPDKNNNTVMKVYEDKNVLYRPFNPLCDTGFSDHLVYPYVENIYKGQASLPSSHVLTTDRMFAQKVKEAVNGVLNANKGLDRKV